MTHAIIVTGDCLSSGHEMLDPEIFKDYFKKLIKLPSKKYWDVRLDKMKDLFINNDPKYIRKSDIVKTLLARKQIQELELNVSWPALLDKQRNEKVINLSEEGAGFEYNIIKFERFLEARKDINPKIVIHQIPGHYRVTIKSDATELNFPRHTGPNILELDTLHYKIKKLFFKPEGVYYRLEKFKDMVKQDYFNTSIVQCLEKNRQLEKKFNYKTFYFLTQSVTKRLLINQEKILHDDLKAYAFKNFKSGVDCPVVAEYNEWMCDKVNSVFRD